MSKYNCYCCNFHTDIKTKYEDHKKTNKHLSKLNIMTADKDKIIEGLQLEVSYLRGKVEAYERMFKVENTVLGPVKVEPEEQTYDEHVEPTNYDDEEFIDTLDLNVNEELAELIAGLRTEDDAVCDLTDIHNAYEAFMNNPKNNLPYLQVFKDNLTNNNALLDFLYEKVFKHSSVRTTDKYRGRFHLYKEDKWLDVQESTEIFQMIISSFLLHLRKYLKCLKIYYSYDSKTRELDTEREKDIMFLVDKLKNEGGLFDRDYDEDIKYILKKFR